MNNIKKLLAGATFVLIGLLATAPSAQATSVSFQLTDDHCTGGCGPSGTVFGLVTLNDNGGADVTVTVHLNSPYAYAKTGAADFQAFKFNATGVVLSDITVASHTPALVASTGTLNGDGTGSFAFGINCPSCGNGLSSAFTSDIVFTVANASIADLTAKNGNGIIFVADLGNPSTGNTGPVGATTALSTPEPATLTLLGIGLLGLGAGIRRRNLNS